MTPREKADELVNKFYNYVFNPESHKDDNLNWAKECALIAVDEILKEEFFWLQEVGAKKSESEWQEIKQEINKL